MLSWVHSQQAIGDGKLERLLLASWGHLYKEGMAIRPTTWKSVTAQAIFLSRLRDSEDQNQHFTSCSSYLGHSLKKGPYHTTGYPRSKMSLPSPTSYAQGPAYHHPQGDPHLHLGILGTRTLVLTFPYGPSKKHAFVGTGTITSKHSGPRLLFTLPKR
ncbi:hypothetical protein CHU98_g6639 [Xylaria longipes]|nr:hypothetical protein CHU98_g6639 [Xylaria longipes]